MLLFPITLYASYFNVGGAEVLPVREKIKVLDNFLRVCYPVPRPPLADAEETRLQAE